MLRNLIAISVGVVLSIALSLAGYRLVWLLIVGNVEHSANKDAIVRVMLWNMFVVVPAISVVVGGIVASIVRRSGWWLGGVAILSLFIYGFIRGAHGLEIVLSIVYMGLAFAAAFVVSRFKRSVFS